MFVTDEAKLKDLISGLQKGDCPRKTSYHGEWYEWTVGIGDDHSAQIRMPKEDYETLIHL